MVNYVQVASYGQIPALFGLALMSRNLFLEITGKLHVLLGGYKIRVRNDNDYDDHMLSTFLNL